MHTSRMGARKKSQQVLLRKPQTGLYTAVRKSLPTANQIKIIEFRRNVMDMRKSGWSITEIAEVLEVHVETVRTAVIECLKRAADDLDESVQEARQLQNMRLDDLLQAHLPIATSSHKEVRIDKFTGEEQVITVPPDPAAAAIVLKIEERRSKLLALDAPEAKRVEESAVRVYVGVNVNKI